MSIESNISVAFYPDRNTFATPTETPLPQYINWVWMRGSQAHTWQSYKCDLNMFMNVMETKNVEKIYSHNIDSWTIWSHNETDEMPTPVQAN